MFYKENNPISIKEKYQAFKKANANLQEAGTFLKWEEREGENISGGNTHGGVANGDNLGGNPTCKNSISGETFYGNPSAPFIYDGKKLICVRICTTCEVDDESVFFWQDGDIWRRYTAAQSFKLQDPCIAQICGEYVVSGVKGWKVEQNKWSWLCEFYRGKDISNLKHLITGPTLMKDIRLFNTSDNKVGVFTRPQGVLYRKTSGNIADIGFTKVNSLCDLDCTKLVNAPILKGIFKSDEWGGVNHVYTLKNGLQGVIGHMAYGEGEFREGLTVHYYGMAFAFNDKTGEFTDPKIIATTDCFKQIPEAVERTRDVIFSSGIERHGKTATFYCGVGDRRVGTLEIPDPFAEYESLKIQ